MDDLGLNSKQKNLAIKQHLNLTSEARERELDLSVALQADRKETFFKQFFRVKIINIIKTLGFK